MKADDEEHEAAKIPFHAFSSYNRKDGRTHPLVLRRRNRALSMWAEMATMEEIAEALEVDVWTVRNYIRRARRNNDVRAERPYGWDKRKMKAEIRKANIARMIECGMGPKEIAKALGVNVRLVQMRLKEGR